MSALMTVLVLSLSNINIAQGQDQQTWKVTIKDADIRSFVTQVADITGYSFVIDPRVKGKVSVISHASMTKNEVYELFLNVLTVHGFAAVQAGDVIKIIQQNNAKQQGSGFDRYGKVKGERLVTRVIQINHTSALELVPILRPMVAKYGHLAGVASANALIISDHASNINRIYEIIQRLDSAGSEELEIVRLQHAFVGDVVQLLGDLMPNQVVKAGGAGGKPSSGGKSRIRVVANEGRNSLIIRGEKKARGRVKDLIKRLDQPSGQSGKAHVIRLQHADAVKMAEILKGVAAGAPTSPASSGGNRAAGRSSRSSGGTKDASIIADEALNALVIRAEPSVMNDLKDIISQLDVRRAQVLIEAAIVEITGSMTEALGVQLGGGARNRPGGLTSFSLAGFDLPGVAADFLDDGDIDAPPGIPNGLTLGGATDNFALLVTALEDNNNANILSTPSIMTLNNQEAQIVVGQNVPFRTGETTSANNANPFTTISREDVGITLKVKPHIQDGNVIRLEVEQSTDSVAEQAIAGQADLITNTREIKTMIIADNQETIVLGGLIEDSVTEQESKVPLLGDIPLFGRLFKSTSERHSKRNLLVFLKPTILREQGEATQLSRRKYRDMLELNFSDDKLEEIKSIPMDVMFDGQNPTSTIRR